MQHKVHAKPGQSIARGLPRHPSHSQPFVPRNDGTLELAFHSKTLAIRWLVGSVWVANGWLEAGLCLQSTSGEEWRNSAG